MGELLELGVEAGRGCSGENHTRLSTVAAPIVLIRKIATWTKKTVQMSDNMAWMSGIDRQGEWVGMTAARGDRSAVPRESNPE